MEKEDKLNRDALLSGEIQKLAKSRAGAMRLMTDEERELLVAETIANAPMAGKNNPEIWVFGYGSLIWNPALEFDKQYRCSITGYHRSFCFWTKIGRGSEEQPGLMMGLEPGGECHGIAYRLPADQLQIELDVLFRREMFSFVYKPTWIEARGADNSNDSTGNDSIQVLAFVVDPENERFCGELDEDQLVQTIATAEGPLGKNCDYLYQLVEHLDNLGLNDPVMTDLAKKVSHFQSTD